MNHLFAFETALFLAAMEVQIFDGEEAQMVWADFLAGDLPALGVTK
jgi:hypothetical protein